MEKKNTGWKVLTCFLLIIILAMGGFILYDKVLKDKYFSKDKTKETDKKETDKKEDNKFQKIVDKYFTVDDGNYYLYTMQNVKPTEANISAEYQKGNDYDITLNGTNHVLSVYYDDSDNNEECKKDHNPSICVRRKKYIFDNKKYGKEDIFDVFYGDQEDDELIGKSAIIKDNNGEEYYLFILEAGHDGYVVRETAVFDENSNMLFYYVSTSDFIDENNNTLSPIAENNQFKLYIPDEEESNNALEVIAKVVDGKISLKYSKILENGRWGGMM